MHEILLKRKHQDILQQFHHARGYQNFQTKSKVKKSLKLKKLKFKSEIELKIENLPDELYQLESEHAKAVKLRVNIMLELEVEKPCKT